MAALLDFFVLVSWVPLILVLGGFVAVSKLLEKLTNGAAEKVLKAIGIVRLTYNTQQGFNQLINSFRLTV